MPDPVPDPTRLREMLANRDVPCPECGYNLRGLQAGACPECGSQLSLAYLRHNADAPAMEAMCLSGLVLGLLVGPAFALALYKRFARDPLEELTLWLPALAGFIVVGCGVSWLCSRRTWARRRATVAMWHGGVVWFVDLAMLLILAILFLAS